MAHCKQKKYTETKIKITFKKEMGIESRNETKRKEMVQRGEEWKRTKNNDEQQRKKKESVRQKTKRE